MTSRKTFTNTEVPRRAFPRAESTQLKDATDAPSRLYVINSFLRPMRRSKSVRHCEVLQWALNSVRSFFKRYRHSRSSALKKIRTHHVQVEQVHLRKKRSLTSFDCSLVVVRENKKQSATIFDFFDFLPNQHAHGETRRLVPCNARREITARNDRFNYWSFVSITKSARSCQIQTDSPASNYSCPHVCHIDTPTTQWLKNIKRLAHFAQVINRCWILHSTFNSLPLRSS